MFAYSSKRPRYKAISKITMDYCEDLLFYSGNQTYANKINKTNRKVSLCEVCRFFQVQLNMRESFHFNVDFHVQWVIAHRYRSNCIDLQLQWKTNFSLLLDIGLNEKSQNFRMRVWQQFKKVNISVNECFPNSLASSSVTVV